MRRIISILIFVGFYIVTSFMFVSLLDKFIFFWLLATMFLTFSNKSLRSIPYIGALILILFSSFMYFLDPLNYKLVHYIYKPATWSFYFLTFALISDYVREFKS
jgi:hypothetical protein